MDQKIKNAFVFLVVLLLFFILYKFWHSQSVYNLKNEMRIQNDSLGQSQVKISADYIPEVWGNKGDTVWEGVGFEPGFSIEIKRREEFQNKGIHEYPTKVSFQNDGELEGVLRNSLPATGYNADYFASYDGNLLVGGDAAVWAEVKFAAEKCIKPSGESADFSLTLNYAGKTFTGCAEKVK